jgi:hypothetical protein
MGISYAEEATATFTLVCDNCSYEEKIHRENSPETLDGWCRIRFEEDTIVTCTHLGRVGSLCCIACTRAARRVYARLGDSPDAQA